MADANHIALTSETALRRCYKCCTSKPIIDFSVCNGKPTTLCKPCKRVQGREYSARNREKIREQRKSRWLDKKAAAVPKRPLTLDRLKELMSYDPETGAFTVVATRFGPRSKGDSVGHPNGKGYLATIIDDHSILLHRLAWFYVHGKWPDFHIDHIDGNKSNNGISNLRDVPASINLQNQRRAHKGNKSGFLGVTVHYGKFVAQIRVENKVINLGRYPTPELAHEAYLDAKRKMHEGNTL
jgi:hypothetical protein